jgi:hypothetical protein
MEIKLNNIIGKPAIDSLKIRIPIEKVEILNNDILDQKKKITLNVDSGEIINEQEIKEKSKLIEFDGYNIKVVIATFNNFQSKTQETFLNIFLHSKSLERDYFTGITIENIKKIYHKLMDKKVFYISYKNFMNGLVNDIDIKQDIRLSKDEFKAFCNELKSRAKESSQMEQGAKYWDNGNLTFNRRESSTHARPFVKFYDKDLECFEKNKDFFETHTNINEYHQLRRIEVTCKKSSDIKSQFGLKNSNLTNVLSVSNEELKDYMRYAINKNLNSTIRVERSANQNNNLDKLIHIHFVNSISNQKQTFIQTLEAFLEHFEDDKQNKSRMKKRCLKWYENHQKEIGSKSSTEVVIQLLNYFGVN